MTRTITERMHTKHRRHGTRMHARGAKSHLENIRTRPWFAPTRVRVPRALRDTRDASPRNFYSSLKEPLPTPPREPSRHDATPLRETPAFAVRRCRAYSRRRASFGRGPLEACEAGTVVGWLGLCGEHTRRPNERFVLQHIELLRGRESEVLRVGVACA